jgi:outer membrane protein OmpA-like peptidoglycan-associated protein
MFSKKLFNTKVVKGVIAMSFLATFSTAAFAEDVVSFHGKDPSSDDLLNAFMGKEESASSMPEGLVPTGQTESGGVKFRGISLKKKAKPEPEPEPTQSYAATQSISGCQAKAGSVAVNINFQTNSSTIKSQDSNMLGKLAEAMNAPQLRDCMFVVEGHTDASGEAYYNLWLSQKRAESVKNRLQQFSVANNRLVVVGKGEDEPLNPAAPYAAENRRVQFKVMNPAK